MICAITVCLAAITFAQAQDDQFRSKILSVRYPPLAAAARVQGDVHLSIAPGQVNLISGPPLLARIAVESAKSFLPIESETTTGLIYHFVLVDPASIATPTTIRRGDAFDRIFLRMLRLKTEKVVIEYKCQEGVPPPNNIKVTPANIEIWIYGSSGCLMTQSGTLLARR